MSKNTFSGSTAFFLLTVILHLSGIGNVFPLHHHSDLLVSGINTPSQASIAAGLDKVEEALRDISSEAESALADRYDTVDDCLPGGDRGCTLKACGSEHFPESAGFHCFPAESAVTQYGNVTALCDDTSGIFKDGKIGLLRSMNESVASFPPQTNFSSLDAEAFMCATKTLDSTFKAKADNQELQGFQFVVDSQSGATRTYPGVAHPPNSRYCSGYDVRRSPWFVSSLSGAKDVLILLDRSGSMGSSAGFGGYTRMEAVKLAVIEVLKTLTINDRIGMVRFDSSAVSMTGPTLLRAATETVDDLIADVEGLRQFGGTDFQKAFRVGFDILNNTFLDSDNSRRGTTADVRPIILFLTDGRQSGTDSALFNTIDRGQAALPLPAYIHTYSMGSGADNRLPRMIACKNEGIWEKIEQGENPLAKMGRYYRILEKNYAASSVKWTSPYESPLGAGMIITAAKTLLDTRPLPEGVLPQILGVLAADLSLTDLGLEPGKAGANNAFLNAELIHRSQINVTENITWCRLQFLRQEWSGFQCPDWDAPNGSDTNCAANDSHGTSSDSHGRNDTRAGNLSLALCPIPEESTNPYPMCCGDPKPLPTPIPPTPSPPNISAAAPELTEPADLTPLYVTLCVVLVIILILAAIFAYRRFGARNQKRHLFHDPTKHTKFFGVDKDEAFELFDGSGPKPEPQVLDDVHTAEHQKRGAVSEKHVGLVSSSPVGALDPQLESNEGGNDAHNDTYLPPEVQQESTSTTSGQSAAEVLEEDREESLHLSPLRRSTLQVASRPRALSYVEDLTVIGPPKTNFVNSNTTTTTDNKLQFSSSKLIFDNGRMRQGNSSHAADSSQSAHASDDVHIAVAVSSDVNDDHIDDILRRQSTGESDDESTPPCPPPVVGSAGRGGAGGAADDDIEVNDSNISPHRPATSLDHQALHPDLDAPEEILQTGNLHFVDL